ncbi:MULTISPECIES: asparaginase domain-containing protein [Christiangramia]|uniref:Glutamin-(Asparagin-)ase family protein n=2 Tax=Christiangramia forsetii TaxID=411153 RepID=A0M0P2_CHRFK|nr:MULTISPECIES: asparaginase domain-containing protein [Christiangramia]WPY97354.1 asparaginase domain-containing protein [Christiangramia sp. OXR-203]GGG40428.1 asparaginase [Christiangramia forsetii]CAL66187.1 glutamin-(asparagin-)ase family protein [Christiangramia forsetii KT0803]
MIHIITTGGTIEGLDYENPENKTEQSEIAIREFLDLANVSFPYIIERAFSKDSRSITDEDRNFLLKKIKASNAEKILITHGTFTMEDTATYFGKEELKKTIVLVGSFILGSSANTDASFNLGYAICALQFLKPDVYVVMNGRIFHWSNVTKNLESNKFEPKNE